VPAQPGGERAGLAVGQQVHGLWLPMFDQDGVLYDWARWRQPAARSRPRTRVVALRIGNVIGKRQFEQAMTDAADIPVSRLLSNFLHA
jgi:hypothetical protein